MSIRCISNFGILQSIGQINLYFFMANIQMTTAFLITGRIYVKKKCLEEYNRIEIDKGSH